MLRRRLGFRILLALPFLMPAWAATPLNFTAGGATNYGVWSGAVRVSSSAWKPGDTVTLDASLTLSPEHLRNLAGAGIKPDSFILLVTAERTFDYGGHLRLPTDQYMSTLITATGLPIEGGAQGAVTNRFGGPWRTPLDLFVKVPIAHPASRRAARKRPSTHPDNCRPTCRQASTVCGWTTGLRKETPITP